MLEIVKEVKPQYIVMENVVGILSISLLIDKGFLAVTIADRMGHESIDIAYRYAYVFLFTQVEVVSK